MKMLYPWRRETRLWILFTTPWMLEDDELGWRWQLDVAKKLEDVQDMVQSLIDSLKSLEESPDHFPEPSYSQYDSEGDDLWSILSGRAWRLRVHSIFNNNFSPWKEPGLVGVLLPSKGLNISIIWAYCKTRINEMLSINGIQEENTCTWGIPRTAWS